MDPSQGPKNVNWTRRKVPHMYMDPSQGPKNVNCTRHKVPKMYMDPSQGPKNAIRPVTRSQKFISASSSSSSSSGSFLLLRLPQSKGQLFRARSNFDAALSGRVLPQGDVGRVSIRPFSGPGRSKNGLGGGVLGQCPAWQHERPAHTRGLLNPKRRTYHRCRNNSGPAASCWRHLS